jgi:SAM-dependent methyltransferase
MSKDAFDAEAFYKISDPWHVQSQSPNNKRRESVIRSLDDLFAYRDILELGCGEGHLTQILARTSRYITGVDISETAIRRARERNIPNTTFIVGSMTDPKLYRKFDVVVLIEALYYLSPEDQSMVLSAIKRTGATLVISAPVIGANEDRKYYTRPELMELLTSHGFKIEQERMLRLDWRAGALEHLAVRAFGLLYFLLPGAVMDPIFDQLPKRWAYQMLFVCR